MPNRLVYCIQFVQVMYPGATNNKVILDHTSLLGSSIGKLISKDEELMLRIQLLINQ
jgi:hypothetical protein